MHNVHASTETATLNQLQPINDSMINKWEVNHIEYEYFKYRDKWQSNYCPLQLVQN